jgi:hypothetical protein
MKLWKYVVEEDYEGTQFGYNTISEKEIIRDYYPQWEQDMRALGREDEISHENCIQEWVIYYSAWQ